MYETIILEKFKKVPVFSLGSINQIIENKIYAKKFLKRMLLKKKIFKIRRNCYTLYNDPFLISSFVIRPSYISSVSALYYYNLITQIPKEIFCFTIKKSETINFITKINYIHTNYFFGFKYISYRGFKIPIAEIEKAIIDSINIVPLSIVDEAIENINLEKMILYLKKIKKSCIVKRIGFILERNGFDVYDKLKKYINKKYILLDPLKKKKGRKNKKWFIIENDK